MVWKQTVATVVVERVGVRMMQGSEHSRSLSVWCSTSPPLCWINISCQEDLDTYLTATPAPVYLRALRQRTKGGPPGPNVLTEDSHIEISQNNTTHHLETRGVGLQTEFRG